MKKMKFNKEIFMQHKKEITIGGILLVIVLGGILLYSCFFSSKSKVNNKEKELTNLLEVMAKDFYENYYYDISGSDSSARKEKMKQYASSGIKVDLENLGRYNGSVNKKRVAKFVNPVTKKNCDSKKTKVIIYPNGNFGKKDYKIETVLVCGFEK